jgi:hypothetical protein
MPKIRSMSAGRAGASLYNTNVNGNQGGGDKKGGLASTTNKRVQYVIPAIRSRAYSSPDQRKMIYCVNQLGGVGAPSKMFATTADGSCASCSKEAKAHNFVVFAYRQLFGRSVDESGLRKYTKQILNDPRGLAVGMSQVVFDLTNSPEGKKFAGKIGSVEAQKRVADTNDFISNATSEPATEIQATETDITKDIAEKYLSLFDTDNNNLIEEGELDKLLEDLDGDLSDEQIQKIIEAISDGKIDKQELESVYVPVLVNTLVKDLDDTKYVENGCWDIAAMIEDGDALYGAMKASFIQYADQNNDGKICTDKEKEEFVKRLLLDLFAQQVQEQERKRNISAGGVIIGDSFVYDYGGGPNDIIALPIPTLSDIITPPLTGEEEWTSKTFGEYLQNNWTLSINRDLESGVELPDGEWTEFSNIAPHLPENPAWGGDTYWAYLETTPVFTEDNDLATGNAKIKFTKK